MAWIPVSLVAVPHVAYAEITQKDFQVVLRTIGFLQNGPKGDAVFAVIYDPANAQSSKDAKDIEDKLGSGVKAGNAVLHPRLVSVNDLGQLGDADFIFVTSQLGPYQDSLAKALLAAKALSFSFDRLYVEKGICAVYINATGRVEILISQEVVKKKGIQFKPVFMMMVTTL